MRNSGNSFVIFPLMVLAAYSCLGDATQQGTILWASTYKKIIEVLNSDIDKKQI